jgi:phospholipid/cholesterol/gamma-HCH transport system ATP-binding protein
VIEASGVVKSFGPRTILRGIDLTVQEGETLVIIGGSGCGKSTFLKCVIGLHTPDSGKLTVDGLEVAKLKTDEEIADYRRRFGYLFQEGALFDSMTVAENITFGLRYLTKDRDGLPRARRPQGGRGLQALGALGRHEEARGAGPGHRRQTYVHFV